MRKQYTKEFKLDAINLVLDQGHTTSEVSRNLEITANMLRRWMREYQKKDVEQAFGGNGKLTPEQGRNPAIKGANQATQAEEGNTIGVDTGLKIDHPLRLKFDQGKQSIEYYASVDKWTGLSWFLPPVDVLV